MFKPEKPPRPAPANGGDKGDGRAVKACGTRDSATHAFARQAKITITKVGPWPAKPAHQAFEQAKP